MLILGVNAYHGDASACTLADGELVAAVEEERFTRIKHCAGFPANAIRYCLEAANAKPGDIEYVAIPRNPWARLRSKVLRSLRMPRFFLDRVKAAAKFSGIREELAEALGVGVGDLSAQFRRVEHHRAHLASSFFVSPFESAVVVSMDGLGDFASTMWGAGTDTEIAVDGCVEFPHSLGLFYTAVTQHLGFWNYGDEYKVMGLASYGEDEYGDAFRKIVELDGENHGSRATDHELQPGFRLALQYFTHHRTGPDFTWREGVPELSRLFSDELATLLGPAREPRSVVESRHENVAHGLQRRAEEAVFHLLNAIHARTPTKRLCLAGGVAYNCVANGKLFDHTPFEQVYIPPAAGDAGLAIGAAAYVYHQSMGRPRAFVMDHAYWGPEYTSEELTSVAEGVAGADSGFKIAKLAESELIKITAKHISEGKIVGWYQGRAEFGPRALGNRSIVVDPRRYDMKDLLNSRIKRREPFRPFAPSILEERTGEWFEKSHPSPFMLMAYQVRPDKRDRIPAPTHVDGTGRLQTVSRRTNPRYWKLIKAFEDLTGVPVVLNTSFNENEPIVDTPQQAADCFKRTKMDVLVMGDCVLERMEGC